MRIDNVSFPYPVLGISDDIIPTLEESKCDVPVITAENDGFGGIAISAQIKLENEDILKYIADGYAEFSLEVSCRDTLYRQCEKFSELEHKFTIPQTKLYGELCFETYVIAKKDINNYTNSGLNPDYKGHVINLHKGDLLVAYTPTAIELDIDLRNVRSPKSFMSVDKNPDANEKRVRFNLKAPKIQILLPEELYLQYKQISKNDSFQEELKASLYLDALVFALHEYAQNKDKNYIWVRTLKYRLQEDAVRSVVDVDDIEELFNPNSTEDHTTEYYILAQTMLNLPYKDLIQKMAKKKGGVKNLVEGVN